MYLGSKWWALWNTIFLVPIYVCMCLKVSNKNGQLVRVFVFVIKKIPHTGDKASLEQCKQQHRCHRRVNQEYPKTRFFLEKRKKSPKTQKLRNVQKYDKISDMPFDQRSLIHREAWFPGGPRIPQNLIFFLRKKYWTSNFGKWGQKDI